MQTNNGLNGFYHFIMPNTWIDGTNEIGLYH